MTQYIDKSALVAEIDKLQDTTMDENKNFLSSYHEGIFDGLSKVEHFINTLEVKYDYLEEFKSLQHINRDLKSTLQDWGYAPNLYYFDGNWHVDWISCDGGDSIKDFTGDTVEEAINKACNWFHSTFCNN